MFYMCNLNINWRIKKTELHTHVIWPISLYLQGTRYFESIALVSHRNFAVYPFALAHSSTDPSFFQICPWSRADSQS